MFGNSTNSITQINDFPDEGGSDQGIGKIDYHISDHHSLNGEFYMGNYAETVVDVVGGAVAVQPYWRELYVVTTRTGRIVEIWTPNSRWLNEARVGYDYQNQPTYTGECGTGTTVGQVGGPANYQTQYGFVSGLPVAQVTCGFPTVSINGFSGLLDGASDRFGKATDLQFADNVSYARGKHQFKFGTDVRDQCACLWTKPQDSQKGTIAFGSPGFAAYAGATPLQSFLSGEPASESIKQGNPFRSVSYTMMALFAQDDWRVTPTLTLNLGVRWEGETPARDKDGLLGNFDSSTPSGMIQPNKLWKFQSDFSPHLGLAWDISGKGTTVIRAGGSVAYVPSALQGWVSVQNASMDTIPTAAVLYNVAGTTMKGPGTIASFQNVNTPANNATTGVITTPLPNWSVNTPLFGTGIQQCGNGMNQVAPGNPAVKNPPPCNMYGVDPNFSLGYVTTWNLSVQHAFRSNLSLNVAYVGSHGTKLGDAADINQPIPANEPSPGLAGGNNELQGRRFYSQYPWFGKFVYIGNYGSSNYDGLQVTLTQRITHGLNFTGGYTWSHTLGLATAGGSQWTGMMDPSNPRLEYASLPYDFRHRFTLTATYNIPGMKSPAQLLSGWVVNASFTYLTPPALLVTDTTDDTSGTGTKLDRWNLLGDPKAFSDIMGASQTVPCYGLATSKLVTAAGSPCTIVPNAAAFPAMCIQQASALPNGPAAGQTGLAQLSAIGCYAVPGAAMVPPAQGTFGSMANSVLRSNASGGFHPLDLSVFKDWKLKERLTIQFRAEAFNALNQTFYANPSVNLGAPSTFGKAASTPDVSKGNPVIGAGGPREIQVGLKLLF